MVCVQVPQTPRKRGRKRASETAPDSPTPVKKAKATPEKRTIPTSYEEAGREDRLLLQMKDKENKTWSEIREAWFGLTGVQVGGSTLSIRYARLKANFVTFTPNDVSVTLPLPGGEEHRLSLRTRTEVQNWHMV